MTLHAPNTETPNKSPITARKFQSHKIARQLELAASVPAADLFLTDVEDLCPKFSPGQIPSPFGNENTNETVHLRIPLKTSP